MTVDIGLLSPSDAPTSFLDDVDADEREQLEAMGIKLATPEENGLDALDMLASELLRRRAGVQRSLDALKATQLHERQMLEYRQGRVLGPLEARATSLDRDIEKLAEIAALKGAFDKKAQSRKTSFGSYGRKRSSGGFAIEDRDAATAWAIEHIPEFVTVKAELSLQAARALKDEGVTDFADKDCKVLADAVYDACEAGAVVPGVVMEEPSVTYYGKPAVLESEEA